MRSPIKNFAQFVTRTLQALIFLAHLQIVRASLWLVGSVSACGLMVFVLAVSGALIINGTTPKFVVEGPSMQPLFHTGDVLELEPFKPTEKLQRGEIIIFHVPGQPPDEPAYVKRVIGLPGERVEMRNTKVYINGSELDEPYIAEPCEPSRCPDKTWQLLSDEYFVLGDNRNHSSDSRAFGIVAAKYIIAKVLSVEQPANNIIGGNEDAVHSTVTAIVATNNAVATFISATATAAASP